MAIAPSSVRVRFPYAQIDWTAVLMRARSIPGGVGRGLLDERERWSLWLPVGFGTGIGAYFACPNEPSRTLVIALLCWGSAAIATAIAIRHTFLRVCCIGCAALLLGFC